MKPGFRTPLVLALIAALLGGYIWLAERNRASTDEGRAARQRVFPALARADILSIEIDRGQSERILLARGAPQAGDDAWQVAPSGQPASSGAVAELIDAIDALEIDREATSTPAAAGLTPPRATLAIATATTPAASASPPSGSASARRFVLEIGGLDASGRGAFVRRAGETSPLVVARRLRDLVDRDPSSFRERRLFTAGVVEAADAIAFEASGRPRRTLRRHDGLWLDEVGFFASRAAVAEVLRALAGLAVSGFPAADGAERAEGPPRRTGTLTRTLTLELGGAPTARLEVWDQGCLVDSGAPQRWARLTGATGAPPVSPPQAICLDGAAVDQLWRHLEAADRREPDLLVIDPADADGFVLSEGGRRLHLRRDASAGWRLVEPAVAYAVDSRRVDDWLASLAAVSLSDPGREARALDDGEAGQAGGARHLTLEGARRVEIVAAPPRAGKTRVRRAGEPASATAPASLFADLEPDPRRFRSRIVLELARFDVIAIAVQSPAGHRQLQVDTLAADRLLDALSRLEAERFLPDGQPFVARDVVDLTSKSGTAAPVRTHLEIDGRRCRARLADSPLFVLSARACDGLRSALSTGQEGGAKPPS